MKTVKIGGKPYPVHFGLSTIKNFSIANGMKTVDEFEKFMSSLQDGSIKSLAMMSELLLAGIERGCQLQKTDCDLDADYILDLFSDDPETFAELSNTLAESFTREASTTEKQGGKKKLKQSPGTK